MFKGCHFPSEIILETVRYYLAYKLSYSEIEEIQRERGVKVDHATINRWVIKYAPVFLEHKARRKRSEYLTRGVWMRPTLKSKANGSTAIERSISLEMSSIIISALIAIKLPLKPF